MSLGGGKRPDISEVMDHLKDFQRDTVDYVFRRLYTDPDPVSRFLIADEVGLGKTLVARGLIARAVDHLWDSIERIDVLYICSNQDIARQNIDRLNITADRQFQFASRATLLPITLEQLRGNKLNFVSFTPGTSFRMHSRSGVAKERWVLYRLLLDHWEAHEPTFRNVLRAGVQKGNFKKYIAWYDENESIDEPLAQAFYQELAEHPDFRERYEALAEGFGYRRVNIPIEMRRERDRLIGELRRVLARSSLAALEPDVVSLDEFQRFKYLLDEDHPVALLAREVFEFPEVKVLLLSATPYKMYSLAWERDEDHHEDFFRTAQFLLREHPDRLETLEGSIKHYRDAYLGAGGVQRQRLLTTKGSIESILRSVMVRTERLAATADRNGMLVEQHTGEELIRPRDLHAFRHFDRIAQLVEAGDQIEFWKSSAYPLNLMEDYKVKRSVEEALLVPEVPEIHRLVEEAKDHLLAWDSVLAYERIRSENARLRALFEQSIETGNWKLLWMPPAFPYYGPGRVYKSLKRVGATKTLIFSAWRVVPKVIAMLTSYEAERRMMGEEVEYRYDEVTRKRSPLLNFTRSQDRLTGMPNFTLMYPCWTLATDVDPLQIASSLSNGKTPSQQAVYRQALGQVRELLEEVQERVEVDPSGPRDGRWYWAALAILDTIHHQDHVARWLEAGDEALAWELMIEERSGEEGSTLFEEHVNQLKKVFFDGSASLGREPEDLERVLTRVALAAPATSVLRSLLRLFDPADQAQRPAFSAAAARAGVGFRSLFNQHEAIELINRSYRSGPYWQKALIYSQDGNLQAVMDEYVHILKESLGLMGHDPVESVNKVVENLVTAVSLRSPSLAFDEYELDGGDRYNLTQRRIRCRYALRFGDERSADLEGWTRSADVRVAFNSPFKPYVLATTSVGQEGLDFHQYCHRVVHWNLPSNPVDLEQREGRVHRYKGHVIRRNLAKKYGLGELTIGGGHPTDPWEQLFLRAAEEREPGQNELYPFWVFDVERGFKIERVLPLLPLSRERSRLGWLKRTLVAYRSVMGQPRQEELLEFLAARLTEEEMANFVEELQIDLSPPTGSHR